MAKVGRIGPTRLCMRDLTGAIHPAQTDLRKSARNDGFGPGKLTGLRRKYPMSLGEIRNLDYAILLCNKMDETRVFYRDVMEFPIETDLANWSVFASAQHC